MADDDKNIASSLNSLYAHLNPAGVFSKLDTARAVDVQSIEENVKDTILGINGNFYSWKTIKSSIDTFYQGSNADAAAAIFTKKEFGQKFHAINVKDKVELEDDNYWRGAKNLTSFVPMLAGTKTKCSVSAFVSRDPFISPATKATRDVEIFLNYMPNLAISQLVPFLEVEFESPGQYYDPSKGPASLTTPSYMRFLLGSREANFTTDSVDTFLFEADVLRTKDTVKDENGKIISGRNIMRSGVETFLMPQTLTNMDELSPGPNRLTRVKPFVPFASIEGFDVQVRNAGAGEMVTKTASLKIKLHDKARISEFAEFIRGPSGYSQVVIRTTYGWSAPTGREDDEYSKFINEKMYVEDCWMVKDSQFSFDAGGQVSFTLQLVTKGAKDVQKLMISAGDDNFAKTVKSLNKLRETVSSFYDRLSRADKFSIDVTAKDFLNAAVASGDLSKFKNSNQIISVIQKTAANSYTLNSRELLELSDSLKAIASRGTAFRSNVSENIKKKFDSLSQTDLDPFLPGEINNNETSLYFPDAEIIEHIKAFKKIVEPRNKKIAADLAKAKNDSEGKNIKPIVLNSKVNVVSFGKLFMNFVASAITSLDDIDELQVFFYPMNDSTGPMSGYSIAEFPIDTVSLAYAYAEQLKVLNTNELTLEQFLKLVIDTQFADIRAIGYGKNSFYKDIVPGKNGEAEKKEEAAIQEAEVKWASKYGGWKPPMVTFYFETGEEIVDKNNNARIKRTSSNKRNKNFAIRTNKIIRRIHVYDMQLDPHKLAKSVLAGESDFERGDINKGKLRNQINSALDKLSKEQAKRIKEKVDKILRSEPVDEPQLPNADPSASRKKEDKAKEQAILKALAEENIDLTGLKIIDRPQNISYKISSVGNKREAVKSELMRLVPTLTPGTNGTLIRSVNVGSKTDGAIGAANLFQVVKGGTGKYSLSKNGLEEVNQLPIRVVPIQLTMTTLGCPIAGLYQEYFIDLDTGTTIDNLYKLSQIQHQMSPGKFDSSWTFIYTDGYGKFGGAPAVASVFTGEFANLLRDYVEKKGEKPKKSK